MVVTKAQIGLVQYGGNDYFTTLEVRFDGRINGGWECIRNFAKGTSAEYIEEDSFLDEDGKRLVTRVFAEPWVWDLSLGYTIFTVTMEKRHDPKEAASLLAQALKEALGDGLEVTYDEKLLA